MHRYHLLTFRPHISPQIPQCQDKNGTLAPRSLNFGAETTEDSLLATKKGGVSINASGLPNFLPKWSQAAHHEQGVIDDDDEW